MLTRHILDVQMLYNSCMSEATWYVITIVLWLSLQGPSSLQTSIFTATNHIHNVTWDATPTITPWDTSIHSITPLRNSLWTHRCTRPPSHQPQAIITSSGDVITTLTSLNVSTSSHPTGSVVYTPRSRTRTPREHSSLPPPQQRLPPDTRPNEPDVIRPDTPPVGSYHRGTVDIMHHHCPRHSTAFLRQTQQPPATGWSTRMAPIMFSK